MARFHRDILAVAKLRCHFYSRLKSVETPSRIVLFAFNRRRKYGTATSKNKIFPRNLFTLRGTIKIVRRSINNCGDVEDALFLLVGTSHEMRKAFV